MANNKNLKVITSSEMARELQKKSAAKRTPAQMMRFRKYCDNKCVYTPTCPFLSASQSTKKKLCALKQKKVSSADRETPIQQEAIESFISLMRDGREGILKEALAGTYKMRLKTHTGTVTELETYVRILIDLKKAFYPEKEVVDANVNHSFVAPEWISKLEAERRLKEQRKAESIETTAVVKS